MAKKGKLDLLSIILAAVVVVALVLVIVGMFVGQVTCKVTLTALGSSKTETEVIKLFDEAWSKGDVSNVFAIISFIVTILGALTLIVGAVLKFLGKEIKLVTLIGAAVTLVGAVLILIAGLVMANQCGGDKFDYGGDILGGKAVFSAGAGVWLGFVGGLVGAIAGAVPLVLKK